MAKVKYEHWLPSARKWIEAVERTEAEEMFNNKDGFRKLKITKLCGYCNQYDYCPNCILRQTYIHERMVCGRRSFPDELTSYFWLYVRGMNKEQPNFEKALKYAVIIRNAILKDCPDKKQAEKDGIDFSVLEK